MTRSLLWAVGMAAFLSWPGAEVWAQAPGDGDGISEADRVRMVEALQRRAIERKQEATAMARARGWAIRGRTPAGRVFELMELREGKPLYYVTMNVNAAISTAANLIRNTAPYNVTGTNLIVGIWDGGGVRTNHQEFTLPTRVFIRDGAAFDDHATHVGGTIGAKGQTASALGMAPSVTIHSYEWTSDASEMTSRAATAPNQTNNIYVSNHSYGYLTGWDQGTYSGTNGYHWFGDVLAEREDRGFGQYSAEARDWDTVCYNAPYYLPFKSAGNDRNDAAPSEGTTFYYYSGGWMSKAYAAASDPYADGYNQGGYDTVDHNGVSKNVMTVGAVNDAVSGGTRSTANATMTAFSCWGPADDGRIKPDIVANGASLYSSIATSTSAYDTYSGTSMSTPNAAGSALLLIHYYRSLFPTQDMRSATLKGLILHTADDIGTTGPDYVNGWGLMNSKAAADHIRQHYDQPSAYFMIEDALYSTNSSKSYSFTWNGSNAIRATLCWTDPAGKSQTGLDVTNRMLVNDLDLRVIGPGGSPTSFPYVLNLASPTNAAATGDNHVDNVEQVYIASPGAAGIYTLRVTHKGTLTNSQQRFSVLLSGTTTGTQDPLSVAPSGDYAPAGPQGGPFAPTSTIYALTNTGGSALSWTAVKDAGLTWLDLSRTNGTLSAGTATAVTFSVNASASSLATGIYSGTVAFSNVTAGTTQSRTATLTVRPVNQFIWSTIATPRQEGVAFTATVTAADSEAQTVTAFTGTAAVSGLASATSAVGVATNGWIYPMSTYYHDARAQVIYLQSELGAANTFNGLALNVAVLPGQSLGNWTIRMKHTAMSVHSPASWEGPASGWTTVYQSNTTISSTGWVWFAFSTPFSYNGVSNLLVDFSHNNSGYTTDGQVRASTGAVGRALVYRSDSADGDPLDWSGATPAPISTNRFPNIRLLTAETVSISRAATGPFTNGVWSGLITVNEAVAQMFLRATSTNGATGDSNAFAVDASAGVPVLATLAVSNIMPTAAMSGGNITSDGGSPVTQRGVCWSTASSPTTNDSKTSNGSGTGSYSGSMTGLIPGQAYYARAYAVNANGAGYGDSVGFSAACFTNAPGGLAAGSVTDTTFTASWNALDGASGYRLDVSTNAAFAGGGGSGAGGLETFSDIGGGTISSYLTRIWTNNGVVWTAYKARTDQSIDGSDAICLRNESGAYFVSGTITGGVDEISLVCTQAFTGSGGTFDIFVNSAKVADAVAITTSIVTTKVTGIGVAGTFTIMVTNSGAVRPVFDNLSWTSSASGGSAFVPGYADRAVAGTSESVTGLTANTLHYFRVRAVSDGGCVSGNSTTQSVITSGGLPAWYVDWAAVQGFDPYGPNGGMDDDYDGDGTPNIDEYTAGTNPTDAGSEFTVLDPRLMSVTQYNLTVSAITGRIYSVYWKTNLTDGLGWSLFKAYTNLPAGERNLILTNSAAFQLYRLGVRSP